MNGFTGMDVLKTAKAQSYDPEVLMMTGFGINMPSNIIEKMTFQNIKANITMTGLVTKGVVIKVRQAIENANIRVTGSDVRSLTTGSMINSTLYCNVLATPDANQDGVSDLPNVGDLLPGFKIRSVKIKGYRNAPVTDFFTNSNIAAFEIRKVSIKNATLNNFGEAFGITANTLKRLSLRQGRTRYKYPTKWLADPLDLTIRVV